MRLSPSYQMPSVAEDWRSRMWGVVPSMLFLALAVPALLMPERPTAVLLLLVGLAAVVFPIVTPIAARRLHGWLLLPRVSQTLKDAQIQIEQGRAAEAQEALEQLAPELANRLSAYRVVVLTVLAYTYAHTGDVEQARAILDTLERGGWHRAFVMRHARAALVSGQVILHAQLSDLERARRVLGYLQPADRGIEVDVARAVLAAREGDANLDALEALAARSYPPARAGMLRLVRLLILAQLPAGDPKRAPYEEALRAGPKRPLTLLKTHWPELYAVAEALEVVGQLGAD